MAEAEHAPTVLVADDSPEILTLVSNTLSRLGAQVIEASDGEKAIELAREHRPTLVVLDVMMPGVSGWEVCRTLKEDEALKNTKILICTGIGEKLNDMTSNLYGADETIDKPLDFEELKNKVKSLLEL